MPFHAQKTELPTVKDTEWWGDTMLTSCDFEPHTKGCGVVKIRIQAVIHRYFAVHMYVFPHSFEKQRLGSILLLSVLLSCQVSDAAPQPFENSDVIVNTAFC
jgi:hypothetical protein